MPKILLFFAFLLAASASAQCPYFSTCASGTPLYCDYSDNDSLYWKAAPYTWSPNLMLTDLPEGSVDLSIVARDSCGGQNLSVEYTLFLDLDGDDTTETVIQSKALPPSGKVLYNNLLNPNYSLGDTILFDRRPGVPDSMKYRFGLQLFRIADLVIANMAWTTGMVNQSYSVPKLPLGKHRIRWRIEQGGVEQFCEYGFEVKDCAPPVVNCVPQFVVNILPTNNISLWATDFIQSSSDNITPSTQLIYGVRKRGEGSGFPLDDQGKPQAYVTFTCCQPALQEVELWVMDQAGLVDSCTTSFIVQDLYGDCFFGCNDHLILNACAVAAGHGVGLEGIYFYLYFTPYSGLVNYYFDLSDGIGCSEFNYVIIPSDIKLFPTKSDNPLNGVTTFDLVLISKHILATEPFDSPYKMIAADANKSGSITTFDIVQLRKLILGIYDTLPGNTSWRFIDKSFVFPNALNPFETALPESVEQLEWTGLPNNFEFYGVKVGDVNFTAIPNANAPIPSENRSPTLFVLPDVCLKAGETLELPIFSTAEANWPGLQFSLDFDPKLLEIESITSSTLPDFDQNNWAQPFPGQLNLSWSSDDAVHVLPNQELFRVKIKAHSNAQLSSIFKTTEHSRFQSETYDPDGQSHSLHWVFSDQEYAIGPRIFPAQPNPTNQGTTIPLMLPQSENVNLEICDPAGRIVWVNQLILEKGSHLLEVPAAAMKHAGLYYCRIQAGETSLNGKIIKNGL